MADGFLGKSIVVDVHLGGSATAPTTGWVRWGACRDKEIGPELDTVDSTHDTSQGNYRSYLTTFATHDIALSGVTSTDAANNLDDIEKYVLDAISAGTQPEVWIRMVRPKSGGEHRTYEFPAMIKNFKVTGTYDDVATWSSDISGTGDIITADA